MSNPQPQNHHNNIIANATLIWHKEGPTFDFDTDLETDDYEYYQAFLSVIRTDNRGVLSRIPLMMAGIHNSEERAMRDLDYTLKEMVRVGVKKELQPRDLEPFDIEEALALVNRLEAK
ncbi:hypothetical protein VTL71DRAFT_1069 [Oculimacula yallundae]|uniref:Uncharacterized protein n=1 Tax=Oculimacula yallundae TaxID=86028 RepID=A0ABR4D439_9HELO